MWNNRPTNTTFLWYDYETWGADPKRDRIAQFAAVRTDMDLNPIGEPIDLLCAPSIDTVIDGGAVTITGLSPLELAEKGLSEWEFALQVHQCMSVAGTCSVGYNTIRFDDECTRYLFYRNLLDPYAREWKNGNSRWDILDVVRMTKALRPEGIEWPSHDDGSPSFKLEHLTAANGLAHEKAHDAVSDVLATIAMAKLIRDKQPKLFDYAYKLRSKHEVLRQLDVKNRNIHVHFSGKVPAIEHCMGIELPLLVHPERANEVIVIDLREDPTWVLEHSAEQLAQWLYSKTADLPEGIKRPPFKTIHINRSPMICPYGVLTDEVAQRLDIDRKMIEKHKAVVDQHPEFNRLALEVFTQPHNQPEPSDPEHALYSGFIGDHDRNILNQMSAEVLPQERWLAEAHNLQDDRLQPLVMNILARHFPETLSDAEMDAWQAQRKQILTQSNDGQALTVSEAITKIAELIEQHPDNSALQDTERYLKDLEKRWFDTQPSPLIATIDGNSNTEPVSQPETANPDLHDQLDLF